MASVLQVYEGLKDLTNKEQRGFITPSVFNSFAQIAQTNIFNSILNDQVKAKQLGKQGVDVKGTDSVKQRKKEDLNVFLFTEHVELNDLNYFDKPKYCSKVVAIWDADDSGGEGYNNLIDGVGGIKYELMYDQEILRDVLNSRLSAPTDQYRIALVSDKIYLYGGTDDVMISYYSPIGSSHPVTGDVSNTMSPSIQIDNVSGVEVPVLENSRDFLLPSQYLSDIVYEMARMIGVRLRDQEIIAYTNSKIFEES